MHVTGSTFLDERVQYPDPYWLMDIRTDEWRDYLFETLIQWQGFPTEPATGVFLDVAFHPWYNYEPANWWEEAGADPGHAGLAQWWNPLAADYYGAMREAFAPTADQLKGLPDKFDFTNSPRPQFNIILNSLAPQFLGNQGLHIAQRFDGAEI